MAQIAIVGLGVFGYYLGVELAAKGHDVLGIDLDKTRVQMLKDEIGEAVVADAANAETLKALGVHGVDLAVVAIGSDMLASIRATHALKEIGVAKIFAKALSEEQADILKLMGADEILFPEKDVAMNLARRIDTPNLMEYLPTLANYAIFELQPPESFRGKTLRQLDLINRHGIQILGVRDNVTQGVEFIPRAEYIVGPGEDLIVLATHQDMETFMKKVKGKIED